MKKVLFLLLLLMPLTAVAQVFEDIEELTPVVQKEDPMLGTKGDTIWVSEHVEISPFMRGKKIMLKKPEHVFTSGAKVGYYSSDGTFLCMAPMVMAMPNEDRTRIEFKNAFANDSIPYAEYSDDKFVMKKSWRVRAIDMLRWLQENDGYLRIICETYGNNLYDVKIRIPKRE